MPPCSVHSCQSGKKGQAKVQSFRFPRPPKTELRDRWLRQMHLAVPSAKAVFTSKGPKGMWIPNKDSVVCQLHFTQVFLQLFLLSTVLFFLHQCVAVPLLSCRIPFYHLLLTRIKSLGKNFSSSPLPFQRCSLGKNP